MASLRSGCDPVRRRRRLAALRPPRAHHELGRRAAAGDARPPLRLGRLRRAGDHRPLGADGRAVDAEAARDPVDRAERAGADAGARRARARPRRRGRPGAARRRVRAARRRSSPGSRTTAACPTSRTPTGAASAPSSGGTARACSGSRCGTRGCELELGRGDASIHWDEALEHGRPFFALATDDSHHPGYDSGFAWTMGARGASARRRRCSTRCAPGMFYGSTGPTIRERRGRATATSSCAAAPREASRSTRGRSRGARANAGRLGYPNHAEILERNDDGLITACAARAGRTSAPYGRVEVLDANGKQGLDEPAVDRVAASSSSARASSTCS